jgi:hypothetical protein
MRPALVGRTGADRRIALALVLAGLALLSSIATVSISVGSPNAVARPDSELIAHVEARPQATAGTAVQWLNLTRPGVAPEPRNRMVLVGDPASKNVLLFGGYDATGSGWLGDTWTLAGSAWTQLSLAMSPGARSSAAAAYDPGLGGVVVFGGYDYFPHPAYFNDTWLFKAGNWSELSASVAPSPRSESSMAFDPALNELVLFGGTNGTVYMNDTWAYGADGWTQLLP